MIVVAIIGILATLALPAYEDYTIRTRISQAILNTASCKVAISEAATFGIDGGLPQWNAAGAQLCQSKPWTHNNNQNEAYFVTTQMGALVMKMPHAKDEGDRNEFMIYPFVRGSNGSIRPACRSDFKLGTNRPIVEWRCGTYNTNIGMREKFLPSSCRDNHDVFQLQWDIEHASCATP